MLFYGNERTSSLTWEDALARVGLYEELGFAFQPFSGEALIAIAELLQVFPVLPVSALMEAFPPIVRSRSLAQYCSALVLWLPIYVFQERSVAVAVYVSNLAELNVDWFMSMLEGAAGLQGEISFERAALGPSIASQATDVDAGAVEFFEFKFMPDDNLTLPVSGRKNIAEDLGHEVVHFVEHYIPSRGQVVRHDRLCATGEALGAPVRHIASAMSLHDPGLTASKDAIRKLLVGPRKNSVGYLGLIDAKLARMNKTIRNPHIRAKWCAVNTRMAEEFVSFSQFQWLVIRLARGRR